MTENELLEHAKQGDHRAFKSLVECFEQPIATVVKGILGDCAEAEDVGQEVFIRCYNNESIANLKIKQFSQETFLPSVLVIT